MRQVEEAPLLGLESNRAFIAPKPHWQGHRDRLRTKLIERGANALVDEAPDLVTKGLVLGRVMAEFL